MRHAGERDVETLLTPTAREGLPLLHLLRLHLDPGALFKDASRGPASVRARALDYNRRMRWMLLPYIRRWTLISASSFLGIAPAEAMSLIPAAALAVGCSISLIVIGVTAIAYFLLGAPD
jgi:hypothetical protein